MKIPSLPTLQKEVLLKTHQKPVVPSAIFPVRGKVWRVEGTPAPCLFEAHPARRTVKYPFCIASERAFSTGWPRGGRKNSQGCCGGGDCDSTVSPLNLQLPAGSACCASDASITGTLGPQRGGQEWRTVRKNSPPASP